MGVRGLLPGPIQFVGLFYRMETESTLIEEITIETQQPYKIAEEIFAREVADLALNPVNIIDFKIRTLTFILFSSIIL